MKRVVIGCLVLLGVAGIAGVAGLLWILRERPQLQAEVRVSPEARAGESLPLILALSNPHAHPVTLDSIDVDQSLLAGFQVLSVDPAPTDSIALPLLDQRTWSFDRELPASGTLIVTFELRPVEAGRFTGNVEVCNPQQDCPGFFVDVLVKPPVGTSEPE
jgi:hypothetical protein